MQPNEQPQFSIDYLDQISSVPRQQKSGNDKLFFAVIVVALLAALAVGLFAFLNSGSNNTSDMSRLSVRLKNLQAISDSSQKNIVSSNLRGTNTNLSLLLTNINRDIETPLTTLGVDPTKLDAKIIASEDTTKITERLENARLNATFDRIYTLEMTYQLETLMVLVQQIESNTKSGATKEFLADTYQKIEPIQKQFANFSSASS